MRLSRDVRNSLESKAARYAENVDAAADYLSSRGITREVAVEFGLGFVPQGEEFQGRLSVPYLSPGGVIDIKYRCTNPAHGDHKGISCPKYGKESGLGVHLYNGWALIGNSDRVVLTEGEFDAIAVQSLAGYPAVGYPGVDTWKKQEHWRFCFDSVAEVVVVADGDDPGKQAAERVQESFNRMDLLARVVEMPDNDWTDANGVVHHGHDANSFLVEYGIPEFRTLIER